LVAIAGVVTLASRTWLTRIFVHGGHIGPNDRSALAMDRSNAQRRKRVAEAREIAVGVALFLFAIGLVLIAVAAFDALRDAPKTQHTQNGPPSVASRKYEPSSAMPS
jgi:hypothetical protein